MSISSIPLQTRYILWGKSGGRCQYSGCNKLIYLDNVTQNEFNQAYIAHIIGDKPDGPRGDIELSPKLAKDIENIMLMCDSHHRKVDNNNGNDYSVEVLVEMKKQHEERIKIVTDITNKIRSHILLYGANVGQLQGSLNYGETVPALFPNYFPAERPAIELGLKNSIYKDDNPTYWIIETENLKYHYDTKLQPRIERGDISHLSIFALAPQPLLVYLGTLLSDIPCIEVYQRQREPIQSWKWHKEVTDFSYIIEQPITIFSKVALKLSLSATIASSRITTVLGKDTSIWTVTIPTPNNDFVKSREQLVMFRQTIRLLMDQIKLVHGENNIIHVFPAAPVSIAVELGRIWMPKADLPLIIYDQNNKVGGFIQTIGIGEVNQIALAE